MSNNFAAIDGTGGTAVAVGIDTQIGSTYTCPDCGTKDSGARDRRGETVCQSCGLVLEENSIEQDSEWRAFTAEQKERKSRVGDAVTFTELGKGITTEMGNNWELNNVTPNKRAQYYRLRKWHNRREHTKDRKMVSALDSLKRMVSTLDLPRSVHEETARLYEKAVDHDIVKGRPMQHVLIALIYVVSRRQNAPRTLNQLADVSGVDKRDINSAYRHLADELDIRILPAEPVDYVPCFGSQLGLDGDVQATARRIVEEAQERGLTRGKRPTGVASAGLYLAAEIHGDDLSQQSVAEVTETTRPTIRKLYNAFTQELTVAP